MPCQLITSIRLLSDNKSFKIIIWNATENLWILRHFKDLRLKSKTIFYKQSATLRSRKSTIYPRKQLKKPFDNTGELLDYLNTKYYDIDQFELEFENNFKIKIRGNYSVTFYNNSLLDRNNLIAKLVSIIGFYNFPIDELAINVEYFFEKNNCLSDNGGSPRPDEFSSEEKWKIWLDRSKNIEDGNEMILNRLARIIKIR